MRAHALFITASIFAMVAASPALAQSTVEPVEEPSAFTVTWTTSVASGRVYADQGFTVTDNFSIENDISTCAGDTCFGIWNAHTPGESEVDESEIYVSQGFALGETTVEVAASYVILEGPEIWDVNAIIEHPLSENLSVGLGAEVMRGGFNDTVIRAYADYSTSSGRWTTTISPSVAYSDWSGRVGLGISASVAYTFSNDVAAEVYYDGYVNQESDGFFGVRLVVPLIK